MSKWGDAYTKMNKEEKKCFCKDNYGLFLPNKQLSMVVAGLLFLFFGVFMTGYFLGKGSSIAIITQKMQEDAIVDSVYSTTLVMGDGIQRSNAVNDELSLKIESDTTHIADAESKLPEKEAPENSTHEISRFYAQLIGFGTEKAAQKFAQKLVEKNIPVEVKKRTSKTAKGKVTYWYQVVTAPYENKNDLIAIVDTIIKDEKLKDVSIRTC